MMKRFTKLLSSLIVVFTLISAFSVISFAEEENILVYDTSRYNYDGVVELNVYNWGEYISDGSEDSLNSNKEFENYCLEKFGIRVKVNYSTYDTNENMYSKIKSSAVSYDIIIPSDYMIEKMADEGLLLKFDASSIPNYVNIDDNFKNAYYDKNNQYSVPYSYGMVGIIYNSELVEPDDVKDKSWGLLWNEKYSGKILQFNNPRDAFASAMYYKGLDINSADKAVWDEALKVLMEQKPLLQGYANDEVFNKMESDSASIAPYFAGDYLTMYSQNDKLEFYYPVEGTNYFVDAMCIPKTSKNPYLAMEYINFMIGVEEGDEENSAAIANALYIGYASPNKAVRENEYYRETLVSEDWYGERAEEVLYGTDPILHNKDYAEKIGKTGESAKEAPCYKMFTPELQEYVNKKWEALKTQSAIEPWVHILCALIVGGVLTLAIYTSVVKKQRSKDYRLRDKNAKIKAKRK